MRVSSTRNKGARVCDHPSSDATVRQMKERVGCGGSLELTPVWWCRGEGWVHAFSVSRARGGSWGTLALLELVIL
jgi:hypothetical protein